jgi:Domain of unknown function (DUF4253)
MGIFDRLLGTRGEQPSEVTLDLVAAAPGDLDAVAGLGLPPGRPVVPEGGDAPIAWVTDAVGDHAALWARLAGEFPGTGLWPVLANGLGDGDLSRPWFDGELAGPDPAEPGDVLAFLGHASDAAAWVDEGEEDRDYRLRGLAAPTRSPGPVTITVPTAPTGLLLVPVTRPADVPRALGWMGPANYDFGGSDQSTVLRSWEDRFGAVLIGWASTSCSWWSPRRRPTRRRPSRWAREHYAFCPDNIDQGVGSLEDYVPLVMGNEWYFWWD